jgi:hypothetical protein
MTFFNKKEEVVQIELTRIGREKLSKGQFKPAYYEFLDEDVLYDRKNVAADTSEEQNDIKERLKEKLTLRAPTARQSVPPKDGAVLPENKAIEGLGTFLPYSNYKPSWKITAEDGTLFTASTDISFDPVELATGRTVGPSYEKIPQLNLTCEYEYNAYVKVDKDDEVFEDDVNENPFIQEDNLFTKPENDSFILFNKDFNDFTINVEEKNVLDLKGDFVLEVFKYEYDLDASGNEKLVVDQLFFDEQNVDESSVYWYFDLTTDDLVEPAREGFAFVDEDVKLEDVDDECVDV